MALLCRSTSCSLKSTPASDAFGWGARQAARFRAACLVACLLLAGAVAHAQAVGTQQKGSVLRFDIPAQSLEQALADYSLTTGFSVLVASQLTASLRSTALQGEFAPRQALDRLLQGTSLRVRYSSPTAFTLLPPARSGPRMAPVAPRTDKGGQGSFRGSYYAGLIQKAVTGALCRSRAEDFGRYRASLQLWISAAGVIERARLLESTGRKERDAALPRHLAGVAIDGPLPPGLPQPVTILLTPHPNAMADCRPFGVFAR